MTTIKFDTHITKATLLDIVNKAPQNLIYGDNYAGVTYRITDEGVQTRALLIEKIKQMRDRELTLTKQQAQFLRILVTAYNYGGWTRTAITDQNLPVITALYNAGIRTHVNERTLPYYA